MTRLISGVALAAVAIALIWWLSPAALAVVAALVAAIAFTEYAHIITAIGGRLPYWPTLAATLLACSLIPFPWVTIESVLGVTLLVVAIALLTGERTGPQLVNDAALAML